MSVKLLTDSTAYITSEVAEQLDITTISLNVIINLVSKREVDFTQAEFYGQLQSLPELPTSSQPTIEELYQAFEKLVSAGHDVVAIFLSSKMSGTFSSAHLVRDMILETYPEAKIEILDSESTAMELGLMVTAAAVEANKGKSLEEVVDKALFVQQHSRFLFAPDTLDYLKKGGRIGGASALLGTLLQIKPILTVESGETTIFKKVRTKKKVVAAFLEQLASDHQRQPITEIVVHHIECYEEAEALQEVIQAHYDCPISISSIGPVVGLHVGPGSIGVVYY